MSFMRKIAAAINPFFFHFTLPYTMATLILLSMLGGFVGLLVVNLQCTTSTSSEISVDRVTGSIAEMKMWVDLKLARPNSLAETTTREVEMCTLDVAEFKANDNGQAARGFCLFPPNAALVHLKNFPSAVHWCTKENIQSLGTDIPLFNRLTVEELTETGRDIPGFGKILPLDESEDFSRILASISWEREDAFGTGWCKNAGAYDAVTGESTTEMPAAAAKAMAELCKGDLGEEVDNSFDGYNWCGAGHGVRGGLPLDGWYDWDDIAAPGSFYYTHMFASRVTTTVQICPSITVAATSAFGSVALIELAATIAFGLLLVKLGIAKPASGYESSTAMTLLRGAGSSQELESLKEELNQLKKGTSGGDGKGTAKLQPEKAGLEA